MNGIHGPLDVKWIDGKRWLLLRPFEFHIGGYPSDDVVRVPAGFVTDFASLPRLTRIIWSPSDKIAGKPAVIHDYGYALGTRSRGEWDRIFYEGMLVMIEHQGGGWRLRLRAKTMHLGLRVGGWAAWRGHRKRQQAAEDAGEFYPAILPVE